MNSDSTQNPGLATTAIYIATHNQQICVTDDFLIPIQTGALLSKDLICPVGDHTGDNISSKNREFSELTALYWIWKNDTHSIVGLSHYRRRFRIEPESVSSILNNYDIIIPPPYYFRQSLRDEYTKHHTKEDLKLLISVMHQMHPQMDRILENVLNQNMLLPYNMIITSKDLLCEYCQWLFPILFRLENMLSLDSRDAYQRRVFGFLSERLFTAYVQEHNLHAYICPVALPETSTHFKHLKYNCGRIFNQLYFRWVR